MSIKKRARVSPEQQENIRNLFTYVLVNNPTLSRAELLKMVAEKEKITHTTVQRHVKDIVRPDTPDPS